MIIKKADDKQNQINELQRLISQAPEALKPKIQKELNMLRSGIKGENESAYHIEFNLRDSKNSYILHDLRLEYKGRVAQIDHLIIHRSLNVYVLETKHFNSGIKINDNGEFMQWNSFKKTYEGIHSPLEQNSRHISALKEVFENLIIMPTRLGITLSPRFYSFILVNNDARVDRSNKFDSSSLIKSEQFFKMLNTTLGEFNITSIASMAKIISQETAEDIARQFIRLHRPIKNDYSAKFGIDKIDTKKAIETEVKSVANETVADLNLKNEIKEPDISHQCKKCNSKNIQIQYGKFGYYFKCYDCDGNSNIKLDCGVNGHHEKLRKDGNKFFRDCPECKTSKLFFEN